MNERNVCIGDVVAVGPELMLQVSLPRQPCFKLNHRFEIKDFAPKTWRFSRTGWYYRVLREGSIKAGDEVRLVERPHPEWTIERIQEYLHRNPDNMAMTEKLAAIEEFGNECKKIFRGRVAKQKARERKALLADEEKKQWRDFNLVERQRETPRIVSFVFEATAQPAEGDDDEGLKPGAHVKIKLPNGLVRAYSVVDGNRRRFRLGVALEEKSRGGSQYLHESLQVGGTVQVGNFTNAVPLASSASHHVFVAGGVGITAFLSLVEGLLAINYSVVLHYAVRSVEEVPFRERLDKLGANMVLYDKQKGQRMDVGSLVRDMPWNSHINFCGPRRMMDEALRETRAAGLGEGDAYFEAFGADISGDPFDVVVANRGNTTLKVGPDETLLEILQRRFGDDIASSCEVGNCGTCKLAVKNGRIEHRGTALTEDDKANAMLSCVSRGVGCITVEI